MGPVGPSLHGGGPLLGGSPLKNCAVLSDRPPGEPRQRECVKLGCSGSVDEFLIVGMKRRSQENTEASGWSEWKVC